MKKWMALSVAAALACALGACGKKSKEGEAPPATAAGGSGTAEVAPPSKTGKVTAGPLNLRDEAGLDGAVVGRLSEGEKVIVLGKSGGAVTVDGITAYWYEVETIDQKHGWVFGGYLDVGEAEAPAGTAAGETAADAPLPPINVAAAPSVAGWKAGDYLREGKERAEAGNFAEALPYYKAATELSPQTGNYWFELGMALQELGRHAEAVTAYERAVVLLPDDFWTHNNLGLACIRAQRPRRAVEVLEKALTLKPKGTTDEAAANGIARRNLATAYEMNGQPDKAAALRK
jgi:tetratricopeptide (TPR) repeat protein